MGKRSFFILLAAARLSPAGLFPTLAAALPFRAGLPSCSLLSDSDEVSTRAPPVLFVFLQAGICKFLLHTGSAGLNITNRRPRLLRVGRVDTLHVAKGLRQSKRKREHVSSLPRARNVQRKNLLARMVSTRAPGCDDLKAHAPLYRQNYFTRPA
jgi:hypothetical protein